MSDSDKSAEEFQLPREVPLLRLRQVVVFPYMLAPLSVEGDAEQAAVDAATEAGRVLALVTYRDATGEETFDVGCAVIIQRMLQMPDGGRRAFVRGLTRIRVTGYETVGLVTLAHIEPLEETAPPREETEALSQQLLAIFQVIVNLSPQLPAEAYVQALNVESLSALCDLIASAINLTLEDLQSVLETVDVGERLKLVLRLATRESSRLELADKISSDVRQEVEKTQRDYFLREQRRHIDRELGEAEGQEIEELRQRFADAELPEDARKAGERELDRLARMNPASAEYSVARTYLEWILDLPWMKGDDETIDVDNAQKVLDEDHYDLKDVKDRIVEYLAVRKLKPDIKGPILCFVGPPGVGKTSLGKSIARATGRHFIRMSLGGMRDEAEVRGHRRTYVGALPGRIIQTIRNVGTNNPVVMLDEIDKVGTDWRGDPSSALLEVLDPAQNNTFTDHYMEVPFDLSHVVFITTANVLQTIPAPLLDRMEVLRLPGYTEHEKLQIAKQYLVPRQREEHGLSVKQVRIADASLRKVIMGYTREAGVRNLERAIGTVCRKIARKVAAGEKSIPQVSPKTLAEYLGPQRFFSEVAERVSTPGVVCGLAWTEAGGEILFIEATKMRGSKQLILTGQLGDVMQESARAALSYVRTNATKLGIDDHFFDDVDIHLHVPAGAVPKDGPSAGVAMATALVSLLTGRPAKTSVGMTGEITLRGKVLPIGGVKEKALGAKRAGLNTIILPKRNQPDVGELTDDAKDGMTFIYADTVQDVLENALEGSTKR